ncbi:MAG: TOM (translocase of outer membrane) complex component [Vezdaea aestivalis]|nr:MAG: TOM (translocase of outer membrane) complex component [Vezdaea aestivalis]
MAAAPTPPSSTDLPSISAPAPSTWDRLSSWASENKVVVYTIGAVAVVATSAGVYFYLSGSDRPADSGAKKRSKKERREAKKAAEQAKKDEAQSKTATVQEEVSLPDVDEASVTELSAQERADFAAQFKKAGNELFGSKNYEQAVELYSKAILCKKDPIFYSNRAACFNALGDWEKTIEDTTAALSLDNTYVKALNRRANAYEKVEKHMDALLDVTASCILTEFSDERCAASVERLLKVVAEEKAKKIMEKKTPVLPSASFMMNFLRSFRSKPLPSGLQETEDLKENSGLWYLRHGLLLSQSKTADGYKQASEAFEKALELGDLGNHKAIAYNMRSTFYYLKGQHDLAREDLAKAIEIDPKYTQSYIKRASMFLELGNQEQAMADFETALSFDPLDPDIYYHKAQLHFVFGDLAEAITLYQKSIDLDKDFIFSHIQLGVTQYKMGSIASSTATFRRCIKNFDKNPDGYNYYGELLLDQQKFEDALAKFETAIELEQKQNPACMNVLPLINKALAVLQSKKDFDEAEKLCQKALIIDPECEIAVATLAQLLLQQNRVADAIKYFDRSVELARTEGEMVNAISYAEATRTQLEVQEPNFNDWLSVLTLQSDSSTIPAPDGQVCEDSIPGKFYRQLGTLVFSLQLIPIDSDKSLGRFITLPTTSGDTFMLIGRASKSNLKSVQPKDDNAFFDSPIMSRNHGRFDIDQVHKDIFVTDNGSMHHTFLDGRNLEAEVKTQLSQDQTLTFGADVHRGADCFNPRKFKIKIAWQPILHPTTIAPRKRVHNSNKFTVPTMSDADESDYSDCVLPVLSYDLKPASTGVNNSICSKTSKVKIEDDDDVWSLNLWEKMDKPKDSSIEAGDGSHCEAEKSSHIQSKSSISEESSSDDGSKDIDPDEDLSSDDSSIQDETAAINEQTDPGHNNDKQLPQKPSSEPVLAKSELQSKATLPASAVSGEQTGNQIAPGQHVPIPGTPWAISKARYESNYMSRISIDDIVNRESKPCRDGQLRGSSGIEGSLTPNTKALPLNKTTSSKGETLLSLTPPTKASTSDRAYRATQLGLKYAREQIFASREEERQKLSSAESRPVEIEVSKGDKSLSDVSLKSQAGVPATQRAPHNPLKRKAMDISTLVQSSDLPAPRESLLVTAAKTQVPLAKPVKAAEMPKASARTAGEQPQISSILKQFPYEKPSPKRRRLGRYVASTMAGVAFGAIGVVYGLAATAPPL